MPPIPATERWLAHRDSVSREGVAPWAARTAGAFRLRELQGDHLFIHSSRAALLEMVARDLATLLPTG
jgi:surfactin synthase thioesterase subunit